MVFGLGGLLSTRYASDSSESWSAYVIMSASAPDSKGCGQSGRYVVAAGLANSPAMRRMLEMALLHDLTVRFRVDGCQGSLGFVGALEVR